MAVGLEDISYSQKMKTNKSKVLSKAQLKKKMKIYEKIVDRFELEELYEYERLHNSRSIL
ncbi:hypothetical protein FACS189499_08010 [Clostridia bacterium]|nr:hypothetical protein FACS189499_08010 [Clostridia bacterium]